MSSYIRRRIVIFKMVKQKQNLFFVININIVIIVAWYYVEKR